MIELYVDGASAGNPGKSGIGIFIKGEGQIVRISEPIEPTNNHTAEFLSPSPWYGGSRKADDRDYFCPL